MSANKSISERDHLNNDLHFTSEDVKEAYKPGNALYIAIVNELKPYFPKDSRDLEWDVLPSTIKYILQNSNLPKLR